MASRQLMRKIVCPKQNLRRVFVLVVAVAGVIALIISYSLLGEDSSPAHQRQHLHRPPLHLEPPLQGQRDPDHNDVTGGQGGKAGGQGTFPHPGPQAQFGLRRGRGWGRQQEEGEGDPPRPPQFKYGPRSKEYCNIPDISVVSTGQEGDVPAGYQLKSVYVVIRHGDRAPMYSIRNHPNPSLSCQFNTSAVASVPRLAAFVPTMRAFEGKQGSRNFQNWKLYPSHPECVSAQMTGVGALQHLMNGLALQHKYVHKWQIFGSQFTPDQIQVHSTEYSRTYQSAIAFLYAFLPEFQLNELKIQRAPSMFFCSPRHWGGQCVCPALRVLKQISDQEAAQMNSGIPEFQALYRHLTQVFDLERKQLPWLWALTDVFMAHACHGLPLPCGPRGRCINTTHLETLWSLLDGQGRNQQDMDSYQRYTRLAMHPFLSELAQNMLNATKRRSHTKFHLYSGHDTTVLPLAMALGLKNVHWPRFATRVVFELYERLDGSGHHYIRVLWNGKDVTSKVRFCQGQTKNGLCKLKNFVAFMANQNLQELDGLGSMNYASLCRDVPKMR